MYRGDSGNSTGSADANVVVHRGDSSAESGVADPRQSWAWTLLGVGGPPHNPAWGLLGSVWERGNSVSSEQ